MSSSSYELVLKPRKGWQPIELGEIWQYRQLFGFLVWRDIKIRYRQTVLGGLWAILQPLLAMLVFTFFFHRLTGIASGGPPYPLFAYAGLAAWTFFANAVGTASNSLVGNQVLISKIYFPRILIPLGAIGALLADLLISLLLMGALMVYYRWPLTWSVAWLPVFVLAGLLAASGLGLILSAANVSFRDIKYAVPFFLQMGLFVTPVIYPLDYIPARFQLLMGLNPMTGIVIGVRHALLGTPVRWDLVGISLVVSAVLLVTGLFVFRRMEYRFADII